ncbi:MAG: GFA family protein [Alphaproteobacteria bacterium]|nr:GFA family protein [Alphaproteobacteria bacterium]
MTFDGGCACGAVRYRLTAAPMIVHACHCRDCQRLTGSAFAVNLWIERALVEASGAEPVAFPVPPGGSGKPHDVFACARCSTHLWSKYHAAPGDTLLVRAGTLDDPAAVAPDVHIFTRSKLPWLALPKDARVFDSFYKLDEVWPAESLERWGRNIAEHRQAGA